MEILDSLGKRLSEVAKQVEEKSGEWLEIGKLNLEIFREEEAIRKIYREMGEAVYSAYFEGQNYGGIADGHCREIAERKLKIQNLKQKIDEAKKSGDPVYYNTPHDPAHGSTENALQVMGTSCPTCGARTEAEETEPPVCEGQ